MGGIIDGHVEWAIINRLKAMLDDPPPTKFNVTQTFAIFSAVLLWTKNRGWVADGKKPLSGEADRAADAFRQLLGNEVITSKPWSLSLYEPQLARAEKGVRPAANPVNGDFKDMPVDDFAKWLRNAIGHGDGRTIRPLHKHNRPAYETWLSGFQVLFPETQGSKRILHLCLYNTDMRRIGSLLADRFCEALAKSPTYYEEDVATRVKEVERAA